MNDGVGAGFRDGLTPSWVMCGGTRMVRFRAKMPSGGGSKGLGAGVGSVAEGFCELRGLVREGMAWIAAATR